METLIMSNGRRYWLVVLNADGEWLHWHELTREQKNTLKRAGMELCIDRGMTAP